MPGVCATRRFKGLEPFFDAIAIRGHASERGLGLRQLRLLDLAIDLQPAQLAEHGARLRGELVGFRLQRADPRRGPIGLGFWIALREEARCRDCDDQRCHVQATEARRHGESFCKRQCR